MSCYSWEDEIAPYYEEGDGNARDFVDVPVDSHVNVLSTLRLDFDAFRKLCRSANVAVPKDASGVFRLALQRLNNIKKCNSALAGKDVALERLCVIEGA